MTDRPNTPEEEAAIAAFTKITYLPEADPVERAIELWHAEKRSSKRKKGMQKTIDRQRLQDRTATKRKKRVRRA